MLLVHPAQYASLHHYKKADSISANSRAETLSKTTEVANDSEPDDKGDLVYKCHIDPQAFFEEFNGDKDNLIFGSHLFHTYFDGDG